jgi:DNA-binding response OmpR family regulator
MPERARILVVDDTPSAAQLLEKTLAAKGYSVDLAADGESALKKMQEGPVDLLLTDLMMPGMDGVQLTQAVRADPRCQVLPIVVITGAEKRAQRLRALEAGADDFLAKPVDRAELLARVTSLLRAKRLYDTVERQAVELARWTAELEIRVAAEVERNARLSRLQRFFSPALAERLLADDGELLLASHRREIVVVFLDLRGWTSFSETAAPEEVMQALAEYHAAMGERVLAFEGTIERFTGDGLMVFFNDPLPQPDAAVRALGMSLSMHRGAAELGRRWRARGYEFGLGIGLAQGFATLGRIGFEGRIDYGAVGAVTNLAHRLCQRASAGELLVTARVLASVGEDQGLLKGCSRRDEAAVQIPGLTRPVDLVAIRPRDSAS